MKKKGFFKTLVGLAMVGYLIDIFTSTSGAHILLPIFGLGIGIIDHFLQHRITGYVPAKPFRLALGGFYGAMVVEWIVGIHHWAGALLGILVGFIFYYHYELGVSMPNIKKGETK